MRYAILVLLVLLSSSIVHGETLQVGAIVSLTGPAAEQGRNWLRGAELAQDRLAHEGIKLDLKVEDDATRPASTVSAFTKLANQNKVHGVLGGTWDFLAEAAAPLVARYGVPFVSPTNPAEVFSLSARSTPKFFSNGLSIQATEESVLQVLASPAVLSIAVIVPNVPFGALHAEIFDRMAERGKARIVNKTVFDFVGYQDSLKTAAAKISVLKPNVVFCLADYPGLHVFVSEMRRRQYAGWILTTQHLDEAVKLASKADVFKKVMGFYPEVIDSQFKTSFRAKFGEDPKVYAAEGHDALLFLARALSRSVNLEKEVFETEGVTGMLRATPGQIGISQLRAVPMVVNRNGILEKWSGVISEESQ